MKLLLDTHILLWAVGNCPELPSVARDAISDSKSQNFLSAATIWEISIKLALGRLRFPMARMHELLDQFGCHALPISLDHAAAAGQLPPHHSDPFDRMLIAQAILEQMTIVTTDRLIRRYEVAILG